MPCLLYLQGGWSLQRPMSSQRAAQAGFPGAGETPGGASRAYEALEGGERKTAEDLGRAEEGAGGARPAAWDPDGAGGGRC